MANLIAQDVCNLDLIYNSQYRYSLPKNLLESFLSGKAFDNNENYSFEESENLNKDINDLYQRIVSQNPAKENIAIMTAGAPGAGKTTQLRKDLESNLLQGKQYAYICPDDVCLKNQTRTYRVELQKSDDSIVVRQEAYNKWRPGSNAATHLILGNLIREKYAFYFGTTSSGPSTGKFFEFLKEQGYHIRLIYVSATDEVRWGSVLERDKTFVQTTEQDIGEKGLLLTQRISDTFLKYADEIDFYYRDGVNENAILSAKWLRAEDKEFLGTLQIIARDRYEKIKAIHDDAAKLMTRPDLYWESTVEKVSEIVS